VSGDNRETVEALLDDAERAIQEGVPEEAVELCDRVHALVSGHAGAWFVRGDALRSMGLVAEARDSYRAAALARPDHASSWASHALACLELLQVDDAARSAFRALREDRRSPEGWWVLALIREWKGDDAGALRALLHARWLDPRGYPLPPALTDEDVEEIVGDCLRSLHPEIRDYLLNVAILLEEVPSEEVLRGYSPPASPLDMLGYFNGASLMERSTEDPWSNLPPTIVLFRRNLQRAANTREELVEQLCVTVFHEIGHFLGLDEDDLQRRGLD
jgi:predicted Zn-dependent protease with MMP-like domain